MEIPALLTTCNAAITAKSKIVTGGFKMASDVWKGVCHVFFGGANNFPKISFLLEQPFQKKQWWRRKKEKTRKREKIGEKSDPLTSLPVNCLNNNCLQRQRSCQNWNTQGEGSSGRYAFFYKSLGDIRCFRLYLWWNIKQVVYPFSHFFKGLFVKKCSENDYLSLLFLSLTSAFKSLAPITTQAFLFLSTK